MTDRQRANKAFSLAFPNGGKNFMTPDVLVRTVRGPYAVEVSKGRGFSGEPIFGVTVLTLDGKRTDKGACFTSHDDATAYIDALATEETTNA